MLRFLNISNSSFLLLNIKSGLLNNPSFQLVRWRRKPRWLPMAKSKMFKIPERPKIDERERNELKRLHDRYKTHMHAVRNFLCIEVKKTSATSIAAKQEIINEEEEHLRCLKENEEWNKQIALIREERIRKAEEESQEYVRKKQEAFEERKRLQKEKIDQLVREEKVKAEFYITPENIDKAIEDALSTFVDHNYAIDLDGNIYKGRRTKPGDVPPSEDDKVQASVQAS